MARPPSTPGTVAALFLLAMAISLMIALGRWQMHRAEERRTLLRTLEMGRAHAPLILSATTTPADLTAWRPVLARGTWQPDLSILLENRNHAGRPGYWLVTPLLLEAPRQDAVLVLRGWLPRLPLGQPLTLPQLPAGIQLVRGELARHIPRLFELGSWGLSAESPPIVLPTADGSVPCLQNIELGAYAQATGLSLLPAVLMQTQEIQDGLVRDWPQPSVDFHQNLGYAMQWFSFATIAGIAWLVVAGRAVGRMRRRQR